MANVSATGQFLPLPRCLPFFHGVCSRLYFQKMAITMSPNPLLFLQGDLAMFTLRSGFSSFPLNLSQLVSEVK